jgi:hypothetical protein
MPLTMQASGPGRTTAGDVCARDRSIAWQKWETKLSSGRGRMISSGVRARPFAPPGRTSHFRVRRHHPVPVSALQTSMPADRRVNGARTFARWLLLVVVAFNFLSSPFHAHSHDLGASEGHALLSHELHDAHVGTALDHELDVHAEAPGALSFGHSLVAFWPGSLPKLDGKALLQAVLAPPPAAPASDLRLSIPRPAWAAASERIPIASDRHWRPDGRAPPSLHC